MGMRVKLLTIDRTFLRQLGRAIHNTLKRFANLLGPELFDRAAPLIPICIPVEKSATVSSQSLVSFLIRLRHPRRVCWRTQHADISEDIYNNVRRKHHLHGRRAVLAGVRLSRMMTIVEIDNLWIAYSSVRTQRNLHLTSEFLKKNKRGDISN